MLFINTQEKVSLKTLCCLKKTLRRPRVQLPLKMLDHTEMLLRHIDILDLLTTT